MWKSVQLSCESRTIDFHFLFEEKYYIKLFWIASLIPFCPLLPLVQMWFGFNVGLVKGSIVRVKSKVNGLGSKWTVQTSEIGQLYIKLWAIHFGPVVILTSFQPLSFTEK